ncbi:unnamed protein product [Rotaria socialis]|uniref:Uncharacterized protein n=1 Tax=Rotaria socialis TaxID=392032 RepID=A0A820U0L3_9BILA|nr:unnamed protein product [Rotaria socialis]CAF4483866.1 unnamed protein product [Rotaria socialis]
MFIVELSIRKTIETNNQFFKVVFNFHRLNKVQPGQRSQQIMLDGYSSESSSLSYYGSWAPSATLLNPSKDHHDTPDIPSPSSLRRARFVILQHQQ